MSALRINVDFQADEAIRELAAYEACVKDKAKLHHAMAAGVEHSVVEHLRDLNSRSPNTSFYSRAARSTQVTADDGQGLVLITHQGLALRFYGGRVVPKNVKNLALPTDDVPLTPLNESRMPPGKMGVLAFIPKRGMDVSATTGYLVEGEEKTITRGKNKGGKRIVPKAGGKLLYTLRAWTDHNADESVIPSTAVLLASARDAGAAHIERASQNGGDS